MDRFFSPTAAVLLLLRFLLRLSTAIPLTDESRKVLSKYTKIFGVPVTGGWAVDLPVEIDQSSRLFVVAHCHSLVLLHLQNHETFDMTCYQLAKRQSSA